MSEYKFSDKIRLYIGLRYARFLALAFARLTYLFDSNESELVDQEIERSTIAVIENIFFRFLKHIYRQVG